MTATSHTSSPGNSAPKPTVNDLLRKNHFLLRRLHSLSGIVPVGAFATVHLFTNAQMLWGEHAGGRSEFQHEVDFIHSMPYLLFIEIALWGAIGFHAALGLWYTFTGKNNVSEYRYGGNVRYFLQRVTGILALVFIFIHVATLRWRWDLFGWYTPFWGKGYQAPALAEIKSLHDVALSFPLTAYALQFSAWVALLYLAGVMAVVFHWSNGLWTAAISWGLTISEASMKRWGYLCVGLFVALTVFFGAAFYASLAYDFDTMTAEQKAAFVAIVPGGQEVFDDDAVLHRELQSLGFSLQGLQQLAGQEVSVPATAESIAQPPAGH
jgi:succinate dehydrogenase / fumarate reductase cytochrome b subunit